MLRRTGIADTLLQNLSFAVRSLRRAPGFSASVVVTLALGIGANLTMYRVVDRVLLRPPNHVEEADRVVRLVQRNVSPARSQVEFNPSLSYPELRDLDAARSLAATAAYAFDRPVVGEVEDGERLLTQWATAQLFPLLGVKPALGRFFTFQEDRIGAPGTVVLAWSYWQRRFGGHPNALGKILRIGAGSYTIVGVAPPGFSGASLDPVQLWIPLHPTAEIESGRGWASARGWRWIHLIARLAPQVEREAAEVEATQLHRLGWAAERSPQERSLIMASLMASEGPEVPPWASMVLWLAGISALVLVIACANVANLLLARGIRRRREVAVRLALGVSRTRLVGQFLSEALVLALPAATVAAAVAFYSGQFVASTLLPGLSVHNAGQGGRVLVLTLLIAMLSALGAAFVPAMRTSRLELAEVLKSGVRASSGKSRTQNALLVSQGVFSVVLLVAAGLFLRSLQGVESTDYVGIDSDQLVLARLFLEPGRDDPDQVRRIYQAAQQRLARTPGVHSIAAATTGPFAGSRGVRIELPGRTLPTPPAKTNGPDQVHVGSEFFPTAGLPILRGRGLLASDDAPAAQRVAVISRSMATHYWPEQDALGQCVRIENESRCTTVVGITRDVRWNGPGWQPSFILYLPLGQRSATPGDLLLRVADDPQDYLIDLQSTLRSVSPDIRFVGVRPLESLLAGFTRPWRTGATLCLLFGVLALTVAGVGLYSLLAFRVRQRRHEIAVRGALGASRRRIMGMVVKDGVSLTVAGIALGLLGAALASSWIEPLLIRVSARDPLVYAGVAFLLVSMALLASWLPARRATRFNPAQALRAE